MLGLPDQVRACLFDLDGVLTDTAKVHRKAWKAMFDAYLGERAQRSDEAFVAFDDADYQRYVDGKTREDGVRSFLASRGIQPDERTVRELGDRKNNLFQNTVHTDGVTVFEGSRRYLEAVAAAHLRIAVVSSSANTADVLAVTGLDKFVECRVDGVTMREENIPGKPSPDSYLRAAHTLDIAPANGAVFEDALSGVAAGHAGRFGFVVGVDRVGHPEALRDNGADIVVTDLGELIGS